MSWFPTMRINARQARKIRTLTRELAAVRGANDVLAFKLQQARRDCLLLVECARDRDTAVSFVETAHEIDNR